MIEQIIEKAKELLASGRIDGFVALKAEGEHVGPHVFTDPAELGKLHLGDKDSPGDTRYSVVGLLTRMAKACPGKTFGILVRGCDERALDAVMRESRLSVLDPEHVVKIGFSCPQELAEKHQCYKPWPDALTVGEKTEGIKPGAQVELDLLAELERWRPIMDRCLKCFGCRNVCPVCDCRECTMEIEALVPQRELPPDNSFLFTRAVHMVDRCSYCGLCEEACPASIPLKDLYRTVAKAMGMGLTLPGAPLLVRPVDLFRRPKAI